MRQLIKAFFCGILVSLCAHLTAWFTTETLESIFHFLGHVAGVIIYQLLVWIIKHLLTDGFV